MKKLLFIVSLMLFLPLVTLAAPVQNDIEVIHRLDVSAELDANRNLTVTETIDYDFGSTAKHGIYRNIPETYIRDGVHYSYRYVVDQVLRDGEPEMYETSRQGSVFTVKIGKGSVTIDGSHVYVIKYHTAQAVNFFQDGHSELYWNAVGVDWPIGVEAASFFLKTPLGESTSTLQFVCYVGIFGSDEQSCDMRPQDGGFMVKSMRYLEAGEGMAVVFGFPQNVIKPETTEQMIIRILTDNWILIAPMLALLAMLYLWATRGKDPAAETIIPQYEIPRGMSPLVLSGALTDGQIPTKGITATIIDMARKDYLHIEYSSKKVLFVDVQSYAFLKRKAPPADALGWEKTIWNAMFLEGTREKATFEDLKEEKFYNDVQKIIRRGLTELQKLKIFVANPYLIRALYFVFAIIAFMVVNVAGGDAPVGTLAAFVTAVIITVFGWFMPRRTQEGTSLVAEVKGFKWFLSVTEEERLKFHNAPARTPEQFMDYLPAAIALGVEKEWAKQFEDLQMAPPDWAEGNVRGLTTIGFANAISGLNTASASGIYYPPSSAGAGGSGFSGGGSGGGGGGGGGGSW